MFVLQNCRGKQSNKYEADADISEPPPSPAMKVSSVKEPDIGDYIIFHATTSGSPSYRHTENGSLLVQELCDAINEYLGEDILSLSTVVNHAISKKEDIPDEDVQMWRYLTHSGRDLF